MAADNVEMLKGVDLFSALSDDQLRVVASVCIERTYRKTENIIREDDDDGLALYLICEGEVTVYIGGSDGRETILTMLARGDFFGEMSLLDGEPRSASVRSESDATVLVLRRADFLEQLRKFPDLSMTLLEEMSRRLRKANRQIGSLATLTVFGRVAGTLINLANEKGIRIKDERGRTSVVIRNRPTQQQLAEMSGTTRETVSRVINMLKRRGALAQAGKDLVILNEDDLKSEG